MMTIRLFGAFRNLQNDPELKLETDAKTVRELRQALAKHFSDVKPGFDAVGLLAKSAIANEKEVLQDTSPVSDRLALLPPVSGG